MSSRSALVLAAATLVAGGAIGAGLFAVARPGGSTTTTVVQEAAQQIAAQSGLTVTQVYERVHQGVVDITTSSSSSFTFGRGGRQGSGGEGSGFVYDTAGDIVTNDHVVDGANSIVVRFSDGSTYRAKLVGTDPSTDLAVVKVSAPQSELHPLTLGDSGTAVVGAGVVAIGSPFGYAQSVTSGIVSALHRTMTSPNNYTIDDAIQTDAAINHGNSGGPLLNARAQVIGVNAQIQSESGGSDGVGFAIPSNTVRRIVSTLVEGKVVTHAYLGLSGETATNAHTATAGVLASQVLPGSPAARAGIKSGDVIVRIAGVAVHSFEDMTRVVDAHAPGEVVATTILRHGKTQVVHVTLGKRPGT
ncbi:MAG: trypsin-like peptidase domain-containing protein [Actinobacteria bacterium]|nr:trypsin-like peptidase domain-containing protein [Actinomycetota bacterium]